MRAEIAAAVRALLENLPAQEPAFPEELSDRIVALADVRPTTAARVTDRNSRSSAACGA